MAIWVKDSPDHVRGSRISSKNQVTLPVAVLAKAGIRAGDEVSVTSDALGRIVLERRLNPWEKWAGAFPGAFPPGFLEELRNQDP